MADVESDEWVGTKVLFENERVRVWDFQLLPGQSTKMHTHKRDWMYVYVTEDNQLRITYEAMGEKDSHQPDGHVSFLELSKLPAERLTHMATNIGTKPHRQILIEFK